MEKLTKEQVSAINIYYSDMRLTPKEIMKNMETITGLDDLHGKNYNNGLLAKRKALWKYLDQYPLTKLKIRILEELYDCNGLELR